MDRNFRVLPDGACGHYDLCLRAYLGPRWAAIRVLVYYRLLRNQITAAYWHAGDIDFKKENSIEGINFHFGTKSV